ncbi:hypothetical protein RJ639_011574 [Escallonia herrerae]|uniref:Ubiquitin-like-conjugating enzyme ATG10 n=1 Tax=Escallonia herrerae TaxID=1293975 RepID=A0AA89AP43_9ASTE|nr:hypothetical protein RJ639_011574 [Escallonia herrerae]
MDAVPRDETANVPNSVKASKLITSSYNSVDWHLRCIKGLISSSGSWKLFFFISEYYSILFASMVSDQATIDFSSWNGTLSFSDFHESASAFAEKWKKFNSAVPQWSWVVCPRRPWIAARDVDGYLSMENAFLPRYKEEDNIGDCQIGEEEPSCSDVDERTDNAILVLSYGHEVHFYDFHVVYNSSYRVPMLYFRAYCSDGQPLTLSDIKEDLPASSVKMLKESKWTFITEEEHPYLKRPWYTLHPCGTSEWMKLLFANDALVARDGVVAEQYLVSWFSVVGQVVGLKTPLEMLHSCTRL